MNWQKVVKWRKFYEKKRNENTKPMKYKIAPNFFSVIILLIIGTALFKQFDFQNLKVEKPALAIVYSFAIILSIGFMIKKK